MYYTRAGARVIREPIVKVDSPEGMRMLIDWARDHRAVLSNAHRRLAERHGVPTAGVLFSEPLPVPPTPKFQEEVT